MPRKRTSRVYTRTRGGDTRYYGDFRDYADVGGGREALKPKGGKVATTDPDLAHDIAAQRVRELEKLRRKKQLTDVPRESGLGAFAQYHLEQKAIGDITDKSLAAAELHLQSAVDFFGIDRELGSIDVTEVQAWLRQLLAKRRVRSDAAIAGTTARRYVDSLANLYRRAAAEGYVLPGFNPAAALLDKPRARTPAEAEWLEVHEVALLLAAAEHYTPPALAALRHRERAKARMEPIDSAMARGLIYTLALTGGRRAEVLGLAAADVSLDRHTVSFRPNNWRRLKTRTSWRTVPLWPQLEECLRDYLFAAGARGELLFPSPRTGRVLVDVRPVLDAIAVLCGWNEGEITTKMFRHSYTAARLQTADRILKPGMRPDEPDAFQWVPVSPFTVGRELGHGGDALVRRVYGHLGTVHHRTDVVEFRAEQHRERLGERLVSLRARAAAIAARAGRCRHHYDDGERCGQHGGLSADGLCLWHDPSRRDEARAARPHSRSTTTETAERLEP